MSGDRGRQAERTTTVHNNGSWKRGRDLAPLERQPRARARSVRPHGCASSVCRTSRKAYVNVQRHKGAAFRTVSRGPPMRRVAHSASSRPLVDPSPGCQSTAFRIPVTPTAHSNTANEKGPALTTNPGEEPVYERSINSSTPSLVFGGGSSPDSSLRKLILIFFLVLLEFPPQLHCFTSLDSLRLLFRLY